MPNLSNISSYGGSNLNIKNLDVVDLAADNISCDTLVIGGETVSLSAATINDISYKTQNISSDPGETDSSQTTFINRVDCDSLGVTTNVNVGAVLTAVASVNTDTINPMTGGSVVTVNTGIKATSLNSLQTFSPLVMGATSSAVQLCATSGTGMTQFTNNSANIPVALTVTSASSSQTPLSISNTFNTSQIQNLVKISCPQISTGLVGINMGKTESNGQSIDITYQHIDSVGGSFFDIRSRGSTKSILRGNIKGTYTQSVPNLFQTAIGPDDMLQTGIPTGVQTITIYINGLGLSVNGIPHLRVGLGATIITTGYTCAAEGYGNNRDSTTGGIPITAIALRNVERLYGTVVLTRMYETASTWVWLVSGNVCGSGGSPGGIIYAGSFNISGIVDYSGEIDRIQYHAAYQAGTFNQSNSFIGLSWTF